MNLNQRLQLLLIWLGATMVIYMVSKEVAPQQVVVPVTAIVVNDKEDTFASVQKNPSPEVKHLATNVPTPNVPCTTAPVAATVCPKCGNIPIPGTVLLGTEAILAQARKVVDSVAVNHSAPVINRDVFRKAQACLLDSPFAPADKPAVLIDKNYQPPHDIEAHYKEMLEITLPLRTVKWSTYAGYHGPWMENAFIASFCCDKPLSFFGGLIPLFIQWTDIWHLHHENWFQGLGSNFLSKLRKDVIYITISQHDDGINHSGTKFHPRQSWNILSLSGGGFGHAPIPLLITPQPLYEFDKSAANLFVFAGTFYSYQSTRNHMRTVLETLGKQEPYFSWYIYSGPRWIDCVRSGLLNLTPRGYGRSSFRTTEIIQMGLIPVYLYDDNEWVAYNNSEASLRHFGFSIHSQEFGEFVQATAKGVRTDPNYLRLDWRIEIIKRVRDSHYTLTGLMQQILYFVQNDPRSDIKCQRHPRVNYFGAL